MSLWGAVQVTLRAGAPDLTSLDSVTPATLLGTIWWGLQSVAMSNTIIQNTLYKINRSWQRALTRVCSPMHPDTPGSLSQSRSCCHCHLVGGPDPQVGYEHTGTGCGDVGDLSRVPQWVADCVVQDGEVTLRRGPGDTQGGVAGRLRGRHRGWGY